MIGAASRRINRDNNSKGLFMSETHKLEVCAKQSQALLRFQIKNMRGGS